MDSKTYSKKEQFGELKKKIEEYQQERHERIIYVVRENDRNPFHSFGEESDEEMDFYKMLDEFLESISKLSMESKITLICLCGILIIGVIYILRRYDCHEFVSYFVLYFVSYILLPIIIPLGRTRDRKGRK